MPLTWLSAKDKADRLVATDARTSRGLLRGTVHDDVCNVLGGVAGHAGVFASAKDTAVIGQMLLNGGQYNGKQNGRLTPQGEAAVLCRSGQPRAVRNGLWLFLNSQP